MKGPIILKYFSKELAYVVIDGLWIYENLNDKSYNESYMILM